MTKKFQGKTYLDPKYDPAFKELFDSEDAIKDFLNDILRLADDDKIKNLSFVFDKTLRFRTPKNKKIVLDVFITTDSGRFFNIEMQKWKHDFFIDRTVLYNAALVIKGKIEMDNSADFKSLPEDTHIKPVFSKNKYIMISLPNFKKSKEEVCSRLDSWLYLLNHAGADNDVPDFGNKIIRDALERIRVDRAGYDLLARQERAMKRDEEYKTRLASAVVKAKLELLGNLIAAGKITVDDAVKATGYPKELLGVK